MAATPGSPFSGGDDLDSSQLHMEPDEVDTLREGEDPGTQEPRCWFGVAWAGRRAGGQKGGGVMVVLGPPASLGLCLLTADRMHPFLAIYDLQPLKVHPLVFAPGVPVIAQVVGTERYTSGSKVAGGNLCVCVSVCV